VGWETSATSNCSEYIHYRAKFKTAAFLAAYFLCYFTINFSHYLQYIN